MNIANAETVWRQHVAHLRQESHSSSAIIEFLDLIQDHMLKIQNMIPLDDGFCHVQGYRAEAKVIQRRLDDLIETCEENVEFLGTLKPPSSWSQMAVYTD